jgi:hypothetical protein
MKLSLTRTPATRAGRERGGWFSPARRAPQTKRAYEQSLLGEWVAGAVLVFGGPLLPGAIKLIFGAGQ